MLRQLRHREQVQLALLPLLVSVLQYSSQSVNQGLGLDPQAALDRPRFILQGGKSDGNIGLEHGISEDVMMDLATMGHPVQMMAGQARAIFGRGQIIVRDVTNGVLWGGSDPRADGCAMTF